MSVFLGTTLTSLTLAFIAPFRWNEPASIALVAGGFVYVAGMLVVTTVFNVPLNDALAAVDPAGTAAGPLWARYLSDWTLWNHGRTIASTPACALFIVAVAVR